MGKKGKKAQAGKPKKLTPKDIGKRLDALVKQLEKELEGADMFAPLPPTEDCPICLVPLPRRQNKSYYKVCCGKLICMGCARENEAAINIQNQKNAGKKDKLPILHTCPFCRAPTPTSSQDIMRRFEEKKVLGACACERLAAMLYSGRYGQVEDKLKALDHFIRATELGSVASPTEISKIYNGKGGLITANADRAVMFTKVAAVRGCIQGRHNIGSYEWQRGNHEAGIRHWKIAAKGGSQISLNCLKKIYNTDGKMPGKEFISKDDLDNLYRACHEAQEEVSSEERKKHWGSKDDVFKC